MEGNILSLKFCAIHVVMTIFKYDAVIMMGLLEAEPKLVTRLLAQISLRVFLQTSTN